MPEYRIRLTKTITTVQIIERVIDIPTSDPTKAQAYVEVASSFDTHSLLNPLRHDVWGDSDRNETIACEIVDLKAEDLVLDRAAFLAPPPSLLPTIEVYQPAIEEI